MALSILISVTLTRFTGLDMNVEVAGTLTLLSPSNYYIFKFGHTIYYHI